MYNVSICKLMLMYPLIFYLFIYFSSCWVCVSLHACRGATVCRVNPYGDANPILVLKDPLSGVQRTRLGTFEGNLLFT